MKLVLLINRVESVEGETIVSPQSEWLFAELDLSNLSWSHTYLSGFVALPVLARRVKTIIAANASESAEFNFNSGIKLMSFRLDDPPGTSREVKHENKKK